MINLYTLYILIMNTDADMESVICADQHTFESAPFGHKDYRRLMVTFVALAKVAERKPEKVKDYYKRFRFAALTMNPRGYLNFEKYIDAAHGIKKAAIAAGTY